MRRAERLFEIVQRLRGRRVTAAALAEALGISVRTVYRDIQDLSRSGVPVSGEAGVGYRLDASYHLPPLQFTAEELEALVGGLRILRSWGGPGLARGAESALARISAALPERLRVQMERVALYAPAHAGPAPSPAFECLRLAILAQEVVQLDYADAQGRTSQRSIWPLGLFFWGGVWSLGAWCELRGDFRNFRIDRMLEARPAGRQFPDQPGRQLGDFLRTVQRQARPGV